MNHDCLENSSVVGNSEVVVQYGQAQYKQLLKIQFLKENNYTCKIACNKARNTLSPRRACPGCQH
jgi:hypothetical protein